MRDAISAFAIGTLPTAVLELAVRRDLAGRAAHGAVFRRAGHLVVQGADHVSQREETASVSAGIQVAVARTPLVERLQTDEFQNFCRSIHRPLE
jgi:hypothetical protein